MLSLLTRRRLLHGVPRHSVRALSISLDSEATRVVQHKRVRQHVNPLARQYQEPIVLPDWTSVFAHPNRPIHLDIGCARGKYLNAVAQLFEHERNFIGVEIRQPVIEEAADEAKQRGLRNIAFIHANMNVQQRLLLTSLPGVVESVSIFHPDPWMKKRHIKRRLVTQDFVVALAQLLQPNTPIYVQTDVAELFEYMVEVFNESQLFRMEQLESNPFPLPTDRELYVTKQGGDIFRVKFIVKPRDNDST